MVVMIVLADLMQIETIKKNDIWFSCVSSSEVVFSVYNVPFRPITKRYLRLNKELLAPSTRFAVFVKGLSEHPHVNTNILKTSGNIFRLRIMWLHITIWGKNIFSSYQLRLTCGTKRVMLHRDPCIPNGMHKLLSVMWHLHTPACCHTRQETGSDGS
jgi:hypothetical protein